MIDINTSSWDEINALPDFIIKKMYSSEEFENRKRADEMLGGEKVKNFRPKVVAEGEAVMEYPADETSEDVPF